MWGAIPLFAISMIGVVVGRKPTDTEVDSLFKLSLGGPVAVVYLVAWASIELAFVIRTQVKFRWLLWKSK